MLTQRSAAAPERRLTSGAFAYAGKEIPRARPALTFSQANLWRARAVALVALRSKDGVSGIQRPPQALKSR